MTVKMILTLVINVAIVILTINAFLQFRRNQENIHPGKSKFHFFIYFTSDSNIFSALCSLIMIPYLVNVLGNPAAEIPLAIYVLHFVGTCAVMVTMVTVLVFLGPIAGYALMYTGSDLYLHLICPLLSLVSCILLLPSSLPFYVTFIGILPTVVYGIVYMILVVVIGREKGGWEDFYTFNRGGKWYISAVLMVAGSYLISLGLFFAGKI